MSSGQEKSREDLDARARRGETVVPGGTGGKSIEAQEHLAEGMNRGRKTRKEQLGTERYQEMGRKGGLSTTDESGGERQGERASPLMSPSSGPGQDQELASLASILAFKC
ncbi:hypothetical protein GH714_037233 [Hevea brasiliensis]|uniref:Uncharacterized protein n=1 Tax=Hevea brasiliensis TaxID=3981 RepID=A0A6A6L4H0_HEVBR|nr:hypothetical protein GH714_037233 [Hevea brasiliensis]